MATLDRAIRQHVDPARRATRAGTAEAGEIVSLSADRIATLARESTCLLLRMSRGVGERLFDGIRADAHATKGAFAMIGEWAVVELCREVERLAREGDALPIAERFVRL
ncbi:Hpt domain-containing protein [Burkholderia pyrrocinia]|uniref:Hpt domain-containing protein n=1 Tax=Burkholderia pyrrocinia TaxID=60550 RepID=UPI00158EE9BE|nr:Hpt domain-containing protein [Burkholderia pyrrocinia]